MLTINEYKEKHHLSNVKLADLLGVGRETVARYLEGQPIQRNSDKVLSRCKELGILPPGDKEELLSIKEYQEKHHLSTADLALMIGVQRYMIYIYFKGEGASEETVARMAELGIKHHVSTKKGGRKPKIVAEKEKKKPTKAFSSKILKEYHLAIVREHGNTIVSKNHKADEIIAEFAKFGFKVELNDFQDKNYSGWNTHYVVTLVGGVK